jgi:hypothetical protein
MPCLVRSRLFAHSAFKILTCPRIFLTHSVEASL